jgi:hypothetical protein
VNIGTHGRQTPSGEMRPGHMLDTVEAPIPLQPLWEECGSHIGHLKENATKDLSDSPMPDREMGEDLNDRPNDIQYGLSAKRRGMVTIISDGFPHWIFGINPQDWIKVSWIDYLESQNNTDPLVKGVRQLLGPILECRTPAEMDWKATLDLLFLSGSHAFLHGFKPLSDQVPSLAFNTAQAQGRTKAHLVGDWQGCALTHKAVGGVTHDKVFIQRCNLRASFKLNQCVTRTLAHIINHGPYCPPCQAQPSSKDVSFLKNTGWGSRGLTLAELGDCYDLPSWAKQLVPNTPYLRRVTPLKMLQAPLQAALQQLSPQVKEPARPLQGHDQSIKDTRPDLNTSATWLPLLERWLPATLLGRHIVYCV